MERNKWRENVKGRNDRIWNRVLRVVGVRGEQNMSEAV